MKIALVSQEYPPETGHGGIATQTFLKSKGLVARGHQVHVISHSIDERRSEVDLAGVRVIRIPGPDSEQPIFNDAARWLAYSRLVAQELVTLDSEVGLDIIDVPDWGSEGYFYLMNRDPTDRVPTVLHLHGPLVMFAMAIGWPAMDSDLYAVGSHMESMCVRSADAIFSSSACSADWCSRSYGVPRHSIEIAHLGVDRSIFKPTGVRKERRPTVAFVGKMVRNKGVEDLVEAAQRIVETMPDLQIWLIGPEHDGLAASAMQKAASIGHPNLIRAFGNRSSDELAALLPRAHVFAAPSYYEGGPGFTVLEAMACGLPVVASDGSGLVEAVRDGETGILVPPKDPVGLAAALEQLLKDATLRDRMSGRALETISQEADTEKCVARVEALYERVIVGSREGRDADDLG